MKIIEDDKPEAVITLSKLKEKFKSDTNNGVLVWYNRHDFYLIHAAKYTSNPADIRYNMIMIDNPNGMHDNAFKYSIDELMEFIVEHIDEIYWFRTIGAFAKFVYNLKIA